MLNVTMDYLFTGFTTKSIASNSINLELAEIFSRLTQSEQRECLSYLRGYLAHSDKIYKEELSLMEDTMKQQSKNIDTSLSKDELLAKSVGNSIDTAPAFVKDIFISLGNLSTEFTASDWAVVKKFVDALAGKN